MTTCVPIETEVDCDEAILILEPLFLAVQETFVAYEKREFGSSRLRRTRLECLPGAHDQGSLPDGSPAIRHFAGCRDDGRVIVTAPEIVELPEEMVLAILSHEFGHAMDFAYPGDYIVADGFLVRRPLGHRGDDDRTDRAAVAVMRQWTSRGDDQIEGTADAIAETVTGKKIGYVGPCLLQSFRGGMRPRPAGLR